MKKGETIKAWAVVYKSSLGVGGLDWRVVFDGTKVFYPRIFMTRNEAKEYGKERSDYQNFRIVACKIIL